MSRPPRAATSGAPSGGHAPAVSVVRRPLPSLGPAEDRPEQSVVAVSGRRSASPFAGRWLILSAGGECLLDYALAAPDALLALPLATLCSLTAAVLQFVAAAGGGGAPTRSMQLGGLRISACRGDEFSVVGVRWAAPAEAGDAAWKQKALELRHALAQEGRLQAVLRETAAAADNQRRELLDSYTLSSMLTKGAGGPRSVLGAGDMRAVRGAMEASLSRTLPQLLEAAVASLGGAARGLLGEMRLLEVASLEPLAVAVGGAEVVVPLRAAAAAPPSGTSPRDDATCWRFAQGGAIVSGPVGGLRIAASFIWPGVAGAAAEVPVAAAPPELVGAVFAAARALADVCGCDDAEWLRRHGDVPRLAWGGPPAAEESAAIVAAAAARRFVASILADALARHARR